MHDSGTSISERDIRIGKILSQIHERIARGNAVSQAEVLAAHPDLAEELMRYLEVLGVIKGPQAHLKDLVNNGLIKADDKDGAELGGYQTLRCIGRGAMGIVLKAFDPKLNRPVALKILRPEFADQKLALQRFVREAKAIGKLSDRNIVTVHSAGEEQGVPYLVMEYVEGPTLAEVIQSHGALSTQTTRALFRQLLSGLATAHTAGMMHRDIKPQNLLLEGWPRNVSTEAGEPDLADISAASTSPVKKGLDAPVCLKIADFGLARMTAAETVITSGQGAVGTPQYMSPEQVDSSERIDSRTDLFSAGVVLYEMLTGQPPFAGGSVHIVLHQIIHDKPSDPRSINPSADPAMSALALRLMAKRPQERFASATDVIEALEAGTPVVLPERRRRRRSVFLGIAFLVAVLALSTLFSPSVESYEIVGKTIWATYTDGSRSPIGEFPVAPASDKNWAQVRYSPGKPPIFVMALNKPEDGNCLVGFHAEGNSLQPISLTPQGNESPWPAYQDALAWTASRVLPIDIDRDGGEEVVIIANHPNGFPSRVSIVNPLNNAVIATFWHPGQISEMLVSSDYFGNGQPGIIAYGKNNRIGQRLRDRTDLRDYQIPKDGLPVIMVLDPRLMNGIGPQDVSVGESDVSGVNRYICALVPKTYQSSDLADRASVLLNAQPAKITGFESLEPASDSNAEETRPWFTSLLVRGDEKDQRARVYFDRNLRIQSVSLGGPEGMRTTSEFWKRCWHVLVRDGVLVDG